MRSPFPGMDPYLGHPALWPQVHTRLIVALADALGSVLRPRYWVAIGERTYVALLAPEDLLGLPDVVIVRAEPGPSPALERQEATTLAEPLVAQVPLPEERRERYLEVREVASGEVVTVIELLSPANKRPGEGRRQYEEKRLKVLGSRTHLVEVDLLRGGEPMPVFVRGDGQGGAHRILVSRSDHRPCADLYLFTLRDPIPVFPLPLRQGDKEPLVDLGVLLHDLYERAGYDLVIDYHSAPVPPFNEEDAAWADDLLCQAGLR
ncbi:MAG: DUF4058 family protein [Candidatus Tectomicrobia bacterium]|uniref:DUF4058 family protein n=1 Tax=Tectimicrobiota bacterium TaxID=2528274 RepID=A0A932CM90_UNCTE|nr:DUF4058 family protein [Candidatus Tectomicrobia bacterium]